MPTLRLATWNLRYDSKPDLIPVTLSLEGLPGPLVEPDVYQNVDGEKPWSTRRLEVVRYLLNEDVILAGECVSPTRRVWFLTPRKASKRP